MAERAVVHPSRYNPAVLEAMIPQLLVWRELGLAIHDPYAGTGERLAALAARLGMAYSGTELEGPFIVDSHVVQGDATKRESYPSWPHGVLTSPVYPNGMTDHFDARDGSQRYTYRQARAAITGKDQPLHGNNMGRYGPRGGREAERAYWALAALSVRWWPEHILVNVKDCILDDETYNVVGRWAALLTREGYVITSHQEVAVLGLGNGENRDARVDHEMIIIAHR